jgi:hypothetical protein
LDRWVLPVVAVVLNAALGSGVQVQPGSGPADLVVAPMSVHAPMQLKNNSMHAQ